MQLYLANRETEFILFRPIRSSILSTFVSFISTLRTEFTAEQQIIVGCPTQEQLAAILASVSIKPRTPRQSLSREVSKSPENKQVKKTRQVNLNVFLWNNKPEYVKSFLCHLISIVYQLSLENIPNLQVSRENSQTKETLSQIEEAKSETSSVVDSSEKIQETEIQKETTMMGTGEPPEDLEKK